MNNPLAHALTFKDHTMKKCINKTMEDKVMLVKMNRIFPGYFNDFWGKESYPVNYNSLGFKNLPAVNIEEGDNEYVIEVAAPGLEKKDFRIELEKNCLTISSERENNGQEENERYTRREFGYNAFSRSFTLPETVNHEKIEARHRDGILYVHIPKKEEAKVKPVRNIAVK